MENFGPSSSAFTLENLYANLFNSFQWLSNNSNTSFTNPSHVGVISQNGQPYLNFFFSDPNSWNNAGIFSNLTQQYGGSLVANTNMVMGNNPVFSVSVPVTVFGLPENAVPLLNSMATSQQFYQLPTQSQQNYQPQPVAQQPQPNYQPQSFAQQSQSNYQPQSVAQQPPPPREKRRIVFINAPTNIKITDQNVFDLHKPYEKDTDEQTTRNKQRHLKKYMTTIEEGLYIQKRKNNTFLQPFIPVTLVAGVGPNLFSYGTLDREAFINLSGELKLQAESNKTLIETALMEVYLNMLIAIHSTNKGNKETIAILPQISAGYFAGRDTDLWKNSIRGISVSARKAAIDYFKNIWLPQNNGVPNNYCITDADKTNDSIGTAIELHNQYPGWNIVIGIAGADNSGTGNLQSAAIKGPSKVPQEESVRFCTEFKSQDYEKNTTIYRSSPKIKENQSIATPPQPQNQPSQTQSIDLPANLNVQPSNQPAINSSQSNQQSQLINLLANNPDAQPLNQSTAQSQTLGPINHSKGTPAKKTSTKPPASLWRLLTKINNGDSIVSLQVNQTTSGKNKQQTSKLDITFATPKDTQNFISTYGIKEEGFSKLNNGCTISLLPGSADWLCKYKLASGEEFFTKKIMKEVPLDTEFKPPTYQEILAAYTNSRSNPNAFFSQLPPAFHLGLNRGSAWAYISEQNDKNTKTNTDSASTKTYSQFTCP